MSNLPPGVTENMIPGCATIDLWDLVPEDFEELDASELDDLMGEPVEPDTVTCARCGETVGPYWGRNPQNPDVDDLRFATCWLFDDRLVCDDCREALLAEA